MVRGACGRTVRGARRRRRSGSRRARPGRRRRGRSGRRRGCAARSRSAGARGCTSGRRSGRTTRASWMQPNCSGKSGRYFKVLNPASENGLSLEQRGRECDLVTPRSASSIATGLEAIEVPRSACMVSWSRSTCCLAMVSASSRSASAALSRSAPVLRDHVLRRDRLACEHALGRAPARRRRTYASGGPCASARVPRRRQASAFSPTARGSGFVGLRAAAGR